MIDEVDDWEISFWNMFRLIVENEENEEGLTYNEIRSLLQDQAEDETLELKKIISLVGLNGTLGDSLWRACNCGYLKLIERDGFYAFTTTPDGAHKYLKYYKNPVEKRLEECRVA